MLQAIDEASQCRWFGPGFSSPAELEHGPSQYVDQHGPFDLVVCDEFSIQRYSQKPGRGTMSFSSYACKFQRSQLTYGDVFQDFLRVYDGRKGIALFQLDHFTLRADQRDLLEELFDVYIGWGEEFVAPKPDAGNLNDTEAADGSIDQLILSRWTNNYRDFAASRRERFISIPHAIGASEIKRPPYAKKSYDWSVVGANYTQRMAARHVLDENGIRCSGKLQPYYFALIQKARINPYAHYSTIRFLQLMFQRAIANARFAYTCGSVAKMAIRKYLEIPALGTVLVADDCEGFAAMGFVDGENVIVAKGERVLEVHNALSTELERSQHIAESGQRLVADLHSTSARVHQLRQAFDQIETGTFRGSFWANGRFCLRADFEN